MNNCLIVTCQKIKVNFTALGDDMLIFPQGKIMTKHQTLENGFEYEVCMICKILWHIQHKSVS